MQSLPVSPTSMLYESLIATTVCRNCILVCIRCNTLYYNEYFCSKWNKSSNKNLKIRSNIHRNHRFQVKEPAEGGAWVIQSRYMALREKKKVGKAMKQASASYIAGPYVKTTDVSILILVQF